MNPGTISVRHDERDSFTIAIRGHEFVVDQPLEEGGRDSGPTPTELFVASLAGCVAHYARRFLDRHGLPDDVVVTADWSMAEPPARVGGVVLNVQTVDLPPELAPRFERTVSRCVVHNSLERPPMVTIRRRSLVERRAS
jgi:uncharacterized OsmC-like protein